MGIKEGSNRTVEHIRRRQGVLPAIKLAEGRFAIGADEHLLIDMPGLP
jgi:hypothetical protein